MSCWNEAVPVHRRPGPSRDRDVDDGRGVGGRWSVEERPAPAEPIGSARQRDGGVTAASGEIATPAVATFGAPARRRAVEQPQRRERDDGDGGSHRQSPLVGQVEFEHGSAHVRPNRSGRAGGAIQARNRSAGTQDRRPPRWTPRHAPRSWPRSSAMNATDVRHPGRLVGAAAVRHRREVRAVGLDEQPVERARARPRPARRSALLNVTMPEKLTKAPRSRQRRASSGPPVKQWKIGAGGDALGGEDVERVVPRVAGVDHERQLVLVGERDLGGERVPLRVAGRVVVVVVEAALADGDDRRVVSSRSTIVSTPCGASCGCSPTVANTPGWRRRRRSPPATWLGRSRR